MMVSMSFMMIIINVIIVMAGNTDGVAIYSTGWRVASIATLPTMGIATAVVSVSGAAFGAHSFKNVSIAHLYAIKIGFVIETVIAVVTFIFATRLLTHSIAIAIENYFPHNEVVRLIVISAQRSMQLCRTKLCSLIAGALDCWRNRELTVHCNSVQRSCAVLAQSRVVSCT